MVHIFSSSQNIAIELSSKDHILKIWSEDFLFDDDFNYIGPAVTHKEPYVHMGHLRILTRKMLYTFGGVTRAFEFVEPLLNRLHTPSNDASGDVIINLDFLIDGLPLKMTEPFIAQESFIVENNKAKPIL